MASAVHTRSPGAVKHGAAFVQVLGVGGTRPGAPGTALIGMGRQRMLINCPEGTQRFCIEHGAKFSRLSRILFTRGDPEATGGVTGLLLTLGEVAPKTRIQLHGPEDVANCSYAVPRVGVDFDVNPLTSPSSEAFREELATVHALKLPGLGRKPDAPPSRKSVKQAPSPACEQSARVCYALRFADIPGKFDPERAKALGVRSGPDFGLLASGTSVTSSVGRSVSPEEVMGPSRQGPLALVLDIPTTAHAEEVLEGVDELLAGEEADCAVIFAPRGVVDSRAFQRMVESLGESCCGMIVNGDTLASQTALPSATELQAKLYMIDPRLFSQPRLPPSQHAQHPDAESVPSGSDHEKRGGTGIVLGHMLTAFHLRPLNQAGLDRSSEAPTCTMESFRQSMHTEHDDALSAIQSALTSWELPDRHDNGDSFRPRVTFLGTGASMPSKYRNVSAIYVEMGGDGGVLLDCGEGTLSQLYALCGDSGAEAVLRSLKAVWISHIHADHYAGVPTVLMARKRVLGNGSNEVPLIPVIGPKKLRPLLDEAEKSLPGGMRFHWVDCRKTVKGAREWEPQLAEALEGASIADLTSFPVDHCPQAYGVYLKQKGEGGKALVYSGDTRPCESLVQAAQGVDLLIHEATFEDDLKEEALDKKHSLAKEAAQVAARAGAKSTILTHFSQRYPKIPVLGQEYAHRVGFAFDMLTVDF